MNKAFLEIGKIVSTHGLHGEVRVQPWCDSPEFLCSFSTLYRVDGTPIAVQSARVQKDMAVLRLEGIETVEAANVLRGTVLYLRREDVQLDEGVYFIQDLLGMAVLDADTGERYGVIDDVLETGANDVYVVQAMNEVGEKTAKKYMVPAIPDVVIETDVAQGIMRIRPLEGLFDDAD